MDSLIEGQRLLVRQNKEWTEILVGFESVNRFDLMDEDGTLLGRAAEEGRGLGAALGRQFFGRLREARIHLYDAEGQEVGLVHKVFRWYFHRATIHDGTQLIGAVQRRFSILHRLFSVEDTEGREILRIESPFLRIWTFKLLWQGREVGRISKKWGGLLREAFSDADTFGVEFDPGLNSHTRKLLLGAVFLIDFTCFENNSNSGAAFSFGGD